MAGPRLARDLQNAMLGGVCAGIAKRYDYDVTLVRVVWLLVTVAMGGLGLPLYVAAWVIMPREDQVGLASPPAPGDAQDRSGRDLREVTDRLAEAARVIADKGREAVEEISEIARAPRPESPAPPAAAAPTAPATPAASTDAPTPPTPPTTPTPPSPSA